MPREESALEKLERAQSVAMGAAAPSTLPSGAPRRTGIWGTAAVALLFVLSKLKFLLVGLKFTKFLTTGASMLLAIWAYSMFYGWPFAALFVVLILVHELGHGAAARLIGLPVGAPVFVPFFGAFIALKERPRSTWEDFIIGAGGPVAGSIGAGVCVMLAGTLDPGTAGLFRTVGYFALVVNLFNLVPVWQLDGARMTEAVRPKEGLVATAALLAVLVFFGGRAGHWNPMAVLVIVLAGFRFGSRWFGSRRLPETPLAALEEKLDVPAAEAKVTESQRSTAALTWGALAASLIAAVHVLQKLLPELPR
ncbi:MAG: site-2 protease family protein [Myxococcaceae bacterium]